MITVKLSAPVVWDEKKHDHLDLNFEKLTGRDLIEAESARDAINAAGSQVGYGLCLAAKALKRPVDDLLDLPARDANAVAAEAISFLL
jgi:hypothetical protein